MNIIFQNQSRSNQFLLLNALFLATLVLVGKADPMAIVFAYVFETVVIGFFHVLKLSVIMRNNPSKKEESSITRVFMLVFFIIHFGFFILIQTLFIYIAFAINDERLTTSLSSKILVNIIQLPGFKLVMAAIFITHMVDYFLDFLKNKKYENQDVELYFVKPYIRVFVQQFLAIIPFFFMLFSAKVGIIAALLLISLRTVLDYYLNQMAKNNEKTAMLASYLVKDKPKGIKEMERSLTRYLE